MAARKVLMVLIVAVCAAANGGCRDAGSSKGFELVKIGGESFRLELVADDASRMKGLGGRAGLPADGGMLFVFPAELAVVQHFVMRDCSFDIDIIYLDGRGFVTATHEMKVEQPRMPGEPEADYENRLKRYSSVLPAQFAIELNGGSVRRLGVRVNDKIEVDLERLKRQAS
jgi:hypothetical protein